MKMMIVYLLMTVLITGAAYSMEAPQKRLKLTHVEPCQLLELVKEQRVEQVEFFLSNLVLSNLISSDGTDSINESDDQGNTPLIWAIRRKNIPIIKLLLDQPNINVNHKNVSEYTTLHCAVLLKDTATVKLLLSKPNLRPNEVNKNGCTPLDSAARLQSNEIVAILIQDPRVTLNIVNKQNKTPHDLIAKDPIEHENEQNTTFRRQVFGRFSLDYTIDNWINWEFFKNTHLLTDEILNALVHMIKKVTKDCLIPAYADDNFIKKMILARHEGITPIRKI